MRSKEHFKAETGQSISSGLLLITPAGSPPLSVLMPLSLTLHPELMLTHSSQRHGMSQACVFTCVASSQFPRQLKDKHTQNSFTVVTPLLMDQKPEF